MIVPKRKQRRIGIGGREGWRAMSDRPYNQAVLPTRILARNQRVVEWILRIGAFMCFVGHGAFGVLTKEAWVRYFAVAGIGRDLAYTLMPIVGTFDVLMGCLILVAPVPAVAWWMLVWAAWTATLRPLAGEPFWEALERGGNYGAPAAILLLMAHSHDWRGLFRTGFREMTPAVVVRMKRALTFAIVLLLVGHGALGVLGKPGLVVNYASVTSTASAVWLTPRVGWFEIVLGVMVAFRARPALLIFVAAWKIGTELLFVTAGAPVWEFVERGGSYCAPLALACLAAGFSPLTNLRCASPTSGLRQAPSTPCAPSSNTSTPPASSLRSSSW
jgi:hypothetical protein